MRIARLACATGLVIVVGGGGDDDDGGDAPASGWAKALPIPGGAIQETAAVPLDGRAYVVGGLTSFVDHSARVWVYDTAARTWSAGPDLPQAIHHANVAVVGPTIYVVGFLGAGFAASGTVWRYTPGAAPAWTAGRAMPPGTERGASVVGVIDGIIYVAGGFRGGQAVANVTSCDDPTRLAA
jgi:N-acetylneuraminic acid mutarotase